MTKLETRLKLECGLMTNWGFGFQSSLAAAAPVRQHVLRISGSAAGRLTERSGRETVVVINAADAEGECGEEFVFFVGLDSEQGYRVNNSE